MNTIILPEELMNTSSEFISYLVNTKEDIKDGSISLSELKAIYFTINLDYIRLCERTDTSNYLSSQNTDILIKHCMSEDDFDNALEVVHSRIDDLINNLR